jgi:TolA-binding protein
MRVRALLWVLLVLTGRDCAIAQDASGLADVAQPLADGIPEVAVARLRALLAKDLPAEERRAVNAKLAEALIASGDADEALNVLGNEPLGGSADFAFLRAQAFASTGRWREALPLYHRVAAENGAPFQPDALMGEADAQRALGLRDEALQTLARLHQVREWSAPADLLSIALLIDKHDAAAAARLLDSVQPKRISERKEKRYLHGRLEALLGHTDKAIELFSTILKKPAGATHSVVLGALFSVADLHLQTNKPEAGDDYVEQYIEAHPADSELPRIFAKLDQLYAAERKPSRRELSRWTSDPAQPRRALAQWHLARNDLRSGRRENALQLFNQLRRNHPSLPALGEAYLEFAQLTLEDRHFDEAAAILREARGFQPSAPVLDRINLLEAEADYRAQRWQTAAVAFENAARGSQQVGADGLFNASLAWLQLHDNARAIADSQELAEAGGDVNTRGELLLEQGLVQAAQAEKKAADSLQNFLHDFPRHPRASEAWVALAEIAFHAQPPRVADAQKFLARAAETQPNEAAIERADYLRIWIADAAPDPNAPGVIALANEFLQNHAASRFLPDVRMKLAEAYFRRQDFANAQTQFETLVQQDPKGRFAEKALFFAAESALQSMGAQALDRALVLLDEVVKRDSELKWAARNEEAVVERKLGKPQDALTLYEEVLKGDARPGEKREALCGKADVLYELAAGDREKYKAAMELYQQLAAEPDAPPHWKNQALFKAGMCLEKLNDRPHALETFYRVIGDESRPDKPREYFWFYKAGFNAARLLEDDAKWAPAASVYQKLALAGGDRSEEARSRLSRLRLDHFLWDL